MARSSSFVSRWAVSRSAVAGMGLAALVASAGCTRKATVGQSVTGATASSSQRVDAESLLTLGMTAVQNPEDRNLVLQEKTPEQLQAEMLLEVMRVYSSDRARAEDPAAEQGAGGGRYDYRLKNGSVSFEQNPDGTMSVRVEGVERRQPTLVFNNRDTFHDAVDRLNAWLAASQKDKDASPWRPDAMLDTLPAELRNAGVTFGVLAKLPELKFNRESDFPVTHDGWFLQEAVWLREISRRVTAGSAEPLEQAQKLYDWLVRSIQLRPGPALPTRTVNGREIAGAVPLTPWESLLTGEGHLEHRAWLFVLLARQQGLDAVVLALPNAEAPARPKPWAVGLVHDKQVYLFDLELGAPVPGPNGRPVATITEAAADPAILAALDLPDRPYPVKPADLAKTIALVEATPAYLSRRMAVLQGALSGANSLVLTVNPTRIAGELQGVPEIDAVRLWDFPYRNIRVLVGESPLETELLPRARESLISFVTPQPNIEAAGRADMWCARVADLKGKFVVDEATGGDPGEIAVAADRQAANPMYLRVRKESMAVEQALKDPRTPANLRAYYGAIRPFAQRAAQDASLFLGQVAFERAAEDPRHFNTAANFFQRDVLGDPQSPRRGAAHYMLGRTHEAAGKKDAAVAAYRADDSPQKWASLYRARRLEQAAPATAAKP